MMLTTERKILLIGTLAIVIGLGIWLFQEGNKDKLGRSKDAPGQTFEDLGQNHVPVGTVVEYGSNPPTSGDHYAEPSKPGVYETPQDDRNLVHSLEHGYIILSYNCDLKSTSFFWPSLIKDVSAHGTEDEATESAKATASGSAQLSDAFRSDECHKLVDQLIAIYESKGKRKVIVTPRPNLDTRIAVTAWLKLDKFNEFDKDRIMRFVDAYYDKGPEKTME